MVLHRHEYRGKVLSSETLRERNMNYDSYKCDPPELSLPEPELRDCGECGQQGYRQQFKQCVECGKLICPDCARNQGNICKECLEEGATKMTQIPNERVADLLGLRKGRLSDVNPASSRATTAKWKVARGINFEIWLGRDGEWLYEECRFGRLPDFHTDPAWTGPLFEKLTETVEEISNHTDWVYLESRGELYRVRVRRLDIGLNVTLWPHIGNMVNHPNTAIIAALDTLDKERQHVKG